MGGHYGWVLSSLAPARRRLILAVLGAVLVATVIVVLAWLNRSSRTVRPAVQDVAGPVLLVPGYGGSVASLQPLAESLRAAGKDVQVVALPGDALGDLDVQAAALSKTVTATLRRTGAASVDVVGYSAGGVVARLWVRGHGGGSLARRVITLGSPQHGTQLAALGSLVPGQCPLACQELAPGSTVLAALNEGDETPAGPRWVSVWTTHDGVVVPADSARLDGALNVTVQGVCPSDAVDHSGLPRDRVVQRIVAAELGATVRAPARGC